MGTNMARNNPMVLVVVREKYIEHIALMAQEQVELEFREDIQQMSIMQQNPMMAQNPEMQTMIQNLTIKMESRKAKLEAEMTIEFMNEEQRTIGEFGNDPIAKLRARELDLKAMDDQRKRMEGQERIDLDRMKSMMNQSLQRDKMEQTKNWLNYGQIPH